MQNNIEKFIKGLDFSKEDNKTKIKQWCDYIGINRYISLYDYLKKFYDETLVEDNVIIALAKYDFRIADILYSAIKFVELALRTKILNNFQDIEFSKKDYLYVISEKFTNNKKKLNCSTYYDCKLNKKNCTMENFINESGMDTLIKIFIALPDDLLKEMNENIEDIEKDLCKIKEIRNTIAHGRVIVNMNQKVSLQDYVETIFKYIPSEQVKSRIKKEIKEEISKLEREITNDEILRDIGIDL